MSIKEEANDEGEDGKVSDVELEFQIVSREFSVLVKSCCLHNCYEHCDECWSLATGEQTYYLQIGNA
jgi:hypothetical protein